MTFPAPPLDSSILAYSPYFPNGVISGDWAAYFTALQAVLTSGPVTSFNSRFGVVTPQSGDYTPDIIPWTSGWQGSVTVSEDTLLKTQVNAKTFGAAGDGVTDDTPALQKAVDYLGNNGGGTLFIPAGTYKIDSKNFVIWCSNVDIRGAGMGATIIKKFNTAGYWGDCFDVVGKINGKQYYGMTNGTTFGGGNYSTLTAYTGSTVQAQNVVISDITFDNDASVVDSAANTAGFVNSNNVLVERCAFLNAPQTNVACVNDANTAASGFIKFVDCYISGSKQHQARVSSFNPGANLGLKVKFERCSFYNVAGAEVNEPSIAGRYVHFFYRGGQDSDLVGCEINDCYFDGTGSVCSTNHCKNFRLMRSTLESGIYVTSQAGIVSKAVIWGNRFNASSPKTAFTSEYFLYFANVTDAIFAHNVFNSTVTTGNTLTAVTGFYSPAQIVFDHNTNFSLSLLTNVAAPADVLIHGNVFAKPSVSGSERGLNVGGTNVVVANNIMNNTMVFVGSNTTNLQVLGNKFALTTNEGYNVVDGPGTQTSSKVVDNEVVESGSYPTTNRAILASYTGHIVCNNKLTDPSGNIVGQGLMLTAAPTTGYSRVGDYHYNATPVSGGYSGWRCTASGTPGTWIPFGQLVSKGANVASAATITPTGEIFHITGTSAISTMNLPYTGFVGTLRVIADGAWSTNTSGNIATALVAVANQEYAFTYDGTKWYATSFGSGGAIYNGAPADPTGTASATAVMMGLGGAASITPSKTGRIALTISGQMANTTINDGATVQLRYGTGTAPTNGTAVTGTQTGNSQSFTAAAANGSSGFSISPIVIGLTIGTPYWFDLALNAVGGGTASVKGLTVSAHEI